MGYDRRTKQLKSTNISISQLLSRSNHHENITSLKYTPTAPPSTNLFRVSLLLWDNLWNLIRICECIYSNQHPRPFYSSIWDPITSRPRVSVCISRGLPWNLQIGPFRPLKMKPNQSYYLYHILEVSPSAGFEEIKRSYRKLALRFHPDKCPDQPDSADKVLN